MRTHRLYASSALEPGSETILDKNQSHYLTRVLRVSTGQHLQLFNGDGCDYLATITAIDKHNVHVHISDKQPLDRESNLKTTLAFSIIKLERLEWLLQKATELGANGFIPLVCRYTDGKYRTQYQRKVERMQQIIISSCEQCGRATLPTLEPPIKFAAFIKQVHECQDTSSKLLLHPYQSTRIDSKHTPNSALIVSGPEGGFSQQEVDHAHTYGFQSVQLGARILRAETAPIAALSMAQYIWGDS